MTDPIVEVQPAVDLAKLSLAWELACGKEQRTERTLAEVRLEKGRLLVEARKAFPARGPRAKGWGELLTKWGIEQPTAWKYMQLAGYVENEPAHEISFQKNEIPTYAEAGIIKPKPAPPVSLAPAPVAKAPKAHVNDTPMPAAERAKLVEQNRRIEEERREEARAPLRMEAREQTVAKVLDAYETCIGALNVLHDAGAYLAGCTSSAGDFERAKARVLTLFSMVEDELLRVDLDVRRQAEPKRQLSLVPSPKGERE